MSGVKMLIDTLKYRRLALCFKYMNQPEINLKPKDIVKWKGQFVWIDPKVILVNGRELHWKKISPQMVHKSFLSLEILKSLFPLKKIRSEQEVNLWREKIVRFGGSTSGKLTGETIEHFDLYFGVNHIEVLLANNRYNLINGRHRIFQAQKEEVKQIPVFLKEEKKSLFR